MSLSDVGGRRGLNVRVWFLGHQGRWIPTRKGVVVPVAHLEVLAQAVAEAQRMTGQRSAT